MTTEIENPYGADADMDLGRILLALVGEGYDGVQIGERFDVSPERAEELIALYARRVLRGGSPPAPSAVCLVSGFDGWCMKHGCYHPDRREDR